MCKRRYDDNNMHVAISPEPQAYEGDTVRLADRQAALAQMPRKRHCGGFPWWMLWLIWPAIGLLRMLIERAAGVIGTVENPLIIMQIGAAIVLIVVGTVLLFRENRKDMTWPR